jgi:hypothetical protein
MTEEAENENEGPESSPNAKRLTPDQWEEIERAFRMGEDTITGLGARYGVSAPTISKRFRSKGLHHGMDKPDPSATVAGQVAGIAAAQVAAAPKKTFAERRDENIEKTKTTSYEIHNAIQIMIGNMLREIAGPAKVAPQTKMADIKALNWLAKTNEIARIGKYALLDIAPDPEAVEMPTIIIDDLSDQEIDDLARRNEDDEDGLPPEQEVEIEGDES